MLSQIVKYSAFLAMPVSAGVTGRLSGVGNFHFIDRWITIDGPNDVDAIKTYVTKEYGLQAGEFKIEIGDRESPTATVTPLLDGQQSFHDIPVRYVTGGSWSQPFSLYFPTDHSSSEIGSRVKEWLQANKYNFSGEIDGLIVLARQKASSEVLDVTNYKQRSTAFSELYVGPPEATRMRAVRLGLGLGSDVPMAVEFLLPGGKWNGIVALPTRETRTEMKRVVTAWVAKQHPNFSGESLDVYVEKSDGTWLEYQAGVLFADDIRKLYVVPSGFTPVDLRLPDGKWDKLALPTKETRTEMKRVVTAWVAKQDPNFSAEGLAVYVEKSDRKWLELVDGERGGEQLDAGTFSKLYAGPKDMILFKLSDGTVAPASLRAQVSGTGPITLGFLDKSDKPEDVVKAGKTMHPVEGETFKAMIEREYRGITLPFGLQSQSKRVQEALNSVFEKLQAPAFLEV